MVGSTLRKGELLIICKGYIDRLVGVIVYGEVIDAYEISSTEAKVEVTKEERDGEVVMTARIKPKT